MPKKIFYLIFITIVAIAIVTRFYQLGRVPVSLYVDEVAMLVDAKTVNQTQHDMHGRFWLQAIFPSYGDYKLPIYILIASVFIKIFGDGEWVLRLPSAIAGVLTVLTTGMIGWKLFEIQNSKKENPINTKKWEKQLFLLISSAIVTLSPWSIMFSRTGFEGHLAQFFISWAVLVVLLTSTKRKWLLFLAQILAAISTYTYFSVRFVWVIIFILLFLFINWRNRGDRQEEKQQKRLIIKVVGKKFLSLFFWLVINLTFYYVLLLPMLKSPLYEESTRFRLNTLSVLNVEDWPVVSNKYKELAGNTFFDRLFFHRHLLLLKKLAQNYAVHLSANFLFISGDPNPRHSTGGHGLFLLPLAFLLLPGIYYLSKKYPYQLIILTSWWLIALLPASVPENIPHALRSLNALVPISLILAAGGVFFLKKITAGKLVGNKNILDKKIILFFSLLIIAGSFYQFLDDYFIHYPQLSAHYWQDGYKELAIYLSQRKKINSTEEIYIEPFDDRFFLWVLNYGNYSPTIYKDLPFEKYHLGKIDHFFFKRIDWAGLKKNPTVVIAGVKPAIENELKQHQLQPKWQEEVTGINKQEKFLIIGFGDTKKIF